jgi:hypothetical protein
LFHLVCDPRPAEALARLLPPIYTDAPLPELRARGSRGGVLDIVQRARAILLSPAAEWRAIEPESGDTAYLFTNYVGILAAIPPVCEFLRRTLFGWGWPRHGFHHAHHGFFSSLFGAFVHYAAAFVVVYAMAVIIDGLAPTFSAQKNQQNAMKLAAYSMTPAWLSGVFALIPGLGFLRLVGLLYSLYVFWLGLPILMKSPPDQTPSYAATAIVCGIVLSFVVSAVVGPFW